MNIQSVNTVSKTFAPKINKQVAQQPKKVAGLTNDIFQRSCEVTNPIKTYNAPAPSFTGAFGTWTYRRLPSSTQAVIDKAYENMKQKYGKDVESITFDADEFSPKNEYRLKATLKGDESHSEFYDEKANKLGEEDVTMYSKKGNVYKIVKNIDYRNNSTTKVRSELDNFGRMVVTDEVRIVRDKNNKVIRKEMMTHSPVTGAYDQKYVYPNGTEEVISTARKTKENGKEIIQKDMKSLDGTRTQYKLEQDNKGNKSLKYKITDKNGNVLMNLNKTMQRLSENKVRSTNGDKSYDVTFEKNKITIEENGKEPTEIKISDGSMFSKGLNIEGNRSEMLDLMKKLPAEQLMALGDTVKTLNGLSKDECMMYPTKKQIDTINDVFSVLHETGHAIDYRHSNMVMGNVADIGSDYNLRRIYTQERENFDAAYPNAQRNHVGYFIKQANHYDGKWGGLSEVIAETNALRDSYTTEMSLAPRVQYLQQHYPRTIAYINGRLENYKG